MDERHNELSGQAINPASEDYLNFRIYLFQAIMGIAMSFAFLFALLHDLGINDIGQFHSRVDYLYAAISLLLLLMLIRSRQLFTLTLTLFLIASFATFVSALINVPIDQFRAVWFYLLVLVTYILAGSRAGAAMTVAAMVLLLGVQWGIGLGLTLESVTTILLGLVIMSVITHVYANRVACYARLIEKKNRELHRLASRDPLTGIMNARVYYEVGGVLTDIARRERTPLTILFIDIDHFKQINDRYGHHAGDQVLITLAQTIALELRESDILARIGGEEFSVILPGTDEQGAVTLAEKVRVAIERAVTTVDATSLRITASIGVAEMSIGDLTMGDIQRRADERLYRAKSEGRNRVCCAR